MRNGYCLCTVRENWVKRIRLLVKSCDDNTVRERNTLTHTQWLDRQAKHSGLYGMKCELNPSLAQKRTLLRLLCDFHSTKHEHDDLRL